MKLFGRKYVGVRHLKAENTKLLKSALEKQLEVLRIPEEGGMRPIVGLGAGAPEKAEKEKVHSEN